MKKFRFLRPLILVALLAILLLASSAQAAGKRNFTASLKGRNEVPAVETRGQGEAIFHLSKDETELEFKLIVANIQDVTQAHIHCGAEDVNGPVVAFLFGFDPGGRTINGILSTGTLDSGDIIPRPDSEVCPGGVADFDDLVEKIRSGEAYVNVHTIANPAGEIRGQIH